MNKKLLWIVASLALVVSASSVFAEEAGKRPFSDEKKQSAFAGPSMHLGFGIRMKKAPDLDTYYSAVGGLKVSMFSIWPNEQMYFSFLAPGLQYAGKGVFAPSITPIIFTHAVGLGFAIDFFPVRKDRDGGPVGGSFNLDVLQMVKFIQSMT